MLDILTKLNSWIYNKSPYQFDREVKNSGDVVLWCLDRVNRPINGLYRSKRNQTLTRVVKIDIRESIKQQHLFVVQESIAGRISIPFDQLLQEYQYVYQTQPTELGTADLS